MSAALTRHLRSWFGAWPSADGPGRVGRVVLVPSDRRDEPGWDGTVRPLLGAVRPDGTAVLVVSPAVHDEVAAIVGDRSSTDLLGSSARRHAVGEVVHGPGATLGSGVLRWIARGEERPDRTHEDVGRWLDHRDPRVPPWLRPFGGDVLVALDDDGAYAAGVGVKRHDDLGHELAVVTEEQHRGRGLARRLVASATRRELDRVPVVTYLHGPANVGSARVADAVGFRDRGWRTLGVFGGEAPG